MARPVLATVAAAIASLALGLVTAAAQDASGQVTIESSVENNFPTTITFRLDAAADIDIAGISLRYSILGRGTTVLAKPEEFSPAPAIQAAIDVEVNSQTSYIPVGSEFVYFWEVTLADGSVVVGESQTFFFLPPDKEWEHVENDLVAVYYHGSRRALAMEYLDAAEQTYQEIALGLLDVELQQLPVKVILFATEDEMDRARPGRGSTFDAATTTCGVKVTSDIVMAIPATCGTADRTDTFRHEFTHILTEAAGESALAKLPAWLDEGTAVTGQSEPGSGYTGAFQVAAAADRLIPFVQMATPTNDPRLVNLFYGQAYYMVQFLIEEGGPGKFAELFATIKSGTRFDAALERVYGFDLAGFEERFRAFHGVSSPEPEPTATPVPRQDTQPTPAPTRPPATQNPSVVPGEDEGLSALTLGVIGLAVVMALLAVFFYLLSLMLAGNRASATPSGLPPDDDRGRSQWGPPSP
ncbi:MAG: hypothetical protein Kow0010_06650 [Dehalococcoidia bacterium]